MEKDWLVEELDFLEDLKRRLESYSLDSMPRAEEVFLKKLLDEAVKRRKLHASIRIDTGKG